MGESTKAENTPNLGLETPLLGIYPMEMHTYVHQDMNQKIHTSIIFNSQNGNIQLQWHR